MTPLLIRLPVKDVLPQMTQTKIRLIVGYQNTTLIVFCTEAHGWQFRVISPGGSIFGEMKLYYTAEAAEKAGREWIANGH